MNYVSPLEFAWGLGLDCHLLILVGVHCSEWNGMVETYTCFGNQVRRLYRMGNQSCHHIETAARCTDHFRIETYSTDNFCQFDPRLLIRPIFGFSDVLAFV